jgi:TRAP-type C4-dicarboxylate transport system substrate-binding protein
MISNALWVRKTGRALLGAVLSAAAVAPVWAQDKAVTLRLSTWVPAQHPLNPSLQAWADDLKKASGGSISSTLFPSEQLGKAFDHYDMARDGIADFAWVSPGYQPGRFPIFAAASLPFMVGNAKAGSAAIDAWYRAYAEREMKDVHFCFAFAHDPGTLHSRRKVALPGDVKGMKVRPATGTIGQMMTVLGATNVQSSAPEVRDMLERGVADAVTFPYGSMILFGVDKIATFHVDVPMYVTPLVWVMNKDKYAELSAAQKKAVDEHCTSEWAEKVASNWVDFESAGRTKLLATPGQEFTKLTPEQLDAWRKAVAPVTDIWAEGVKKAGGDPKQVLDSLRASLAKYKSAF